MVQTRPRAGAFVAAYGDLSDFDVADVVSEWIRSVIRLRRDLADRGIEPQRTWVADGAEGRDLEEIAWIEARRQELGTVHPPATSDMSDHS